MASVALIGPDGAGKSTLTRMLVASGVLPFRYLYMGIEIPASNIALPTSRWIERRKARDGWTAGPGTAPARPAGRLWRQSWAAARLLNRIADEWFRQCVSWIYESRGFVVLYDRHYFFDFSPEITGGGGTLDRRLHEWHLRRMYPRPDLVIFLDAPGDVLFARKGESSAEELERRRQGFLSAGRGLPRFVRVDATRPLPDVYAEVTEHVVRFCKPTTRDTSEAPR
jgi:thymidylate kinase